MLLTQTRLVETREQIEQESHQQSNFGRSTRQSRLRHLHLRLNRPAERSHGSSLWIMNFLNWCTKEFAVAEGQGSAVHSSIAFDLTVTSLFTPLAIGRSVMLIPEAEGIEALATALSTPNDFSLIKLTPPILNC